MPSLDCMPVWNEQVAQLITQAVLRQKGKLNKAMAKSHAEGLLELPWSGISAKGIPAWRAMIAQGPARTLKNHSTRSSSSSSNLPQMLFANEDFTFSCPKCSAKRSIANCSLLVRSGWGHILCKTCRSTTRSLTWTCVCGLPWHACSIHSRLIRRDREVSGNRDS